MRENSISTDLLAPLQDARKQLGTPQIIQSEQ
jgi:hypothetical protein